MAPTVEQWKLDVLVAKREGLFQIIQKLYNLLKALSEKEKEKEFRSLVRCLPKTKKSFLEVNDEIMKFRAQFEEKFVPNYDNLITLETMCGEIEVAEERLRKVSENDSNETGRTSGAKPRLPKIELPVFSGNVAEWEQFYSIFSSLIHENGTLSETDKLYYLSGCLRGSAKNVCAGIPMSGDNYGIVWQALLKRYQDKRVLANAYWDEIINFKPIREVSERGLNTFLDTFHTAVKALRNLQLPDLLDFILMSVALDKIGVEVAREFEMSRTACSIPTYDELVNFVMRRIKLLAVTSWKGGSDKYDSQSRKRMPKCFTVKRDDVTGGGCAFCKKGDHGVRQCDDFKERTVQEKYQIVKARGWCFNCLSDRHGVRGCPSESRCFSCGEKHHTLLHGGRPNKAEELGRSPTVEVRQAEDENKATCLHTAVMEGDDRGTVLLGTVAVDVHGSGWGTSRGRFVLDSGSQVTLVTAAFCRRTGLPISKFRALVQGLGDRTQMIKGRTRLRITARHRSDVSYWIEALVAEKVTGKLPQQLLKTKFPMLESVLLADDSFHIPGTVDGVLGADVAAKVIGGNHLDLGEGWPTAVDTKFGYVVMGKMSANWSSPIVLTTTYDASLEEMVKGFWELEEVPVKSSQKSSTECEEHFLRTYKRDAEGRCTVALPFRCDPEVLGDSWQTARRRFLVLEGKFNRNPELKQAYVRAMQDFIDQGHICPVTYESADETSYFIPHHAIFKPQSSTTPVRIVLDASAPSDNGISLNDILHGGPKLQLDIFELLIRFRLCEIAITADLRQMYRQINVCKEHRRFQRLLWRENPSEELKKWELKSLPFGLTASPYLALRTIQQLLVEEQSDFPVATELVKRSIYMDDLVASVSGVVEAGKLCADLVELFARGKFEITKWSSNSKAVLETIPAERRLDGEVKFRSETKILGIVWDPKDDALRIKFPRPPVGATKRIILSAVARCYDPLGVAAPLLLYLKVLIKELWEAKLEWDQEVPPTVEKRWRKILEEWPALQGLTIQRHFGGDKTSGIILFGFADASKDGYGAVVYLQIEGRCGTKFVCAKSRVSPMKATTIPRLELCAALLLSKLLRVVKDALETVTKIWAFSDSTIVLQWLNAAGQPDSFVNNRVEKIKEIIPSAKWLHIAGAENPADCLSRGLTPQQLVDQSTWLVGPLWLAWAEEDWPATIRMAEPRDEPKFETLCITETKEQTHPITELLKRRSSWLFILRVIAWVSRFVKRSPMRGGISVGELREAERKVIGAIQRQHFPTEWKQLVENKEISGRLKGLRPILINGILRVGGRLENADLGMNNKHPIILPKNCELTDRLVDYQHKINLHAGPYLLESIIRQKYWIINGKSVIKKRFRLCNRCFRTQPRTVQPLMGNLPEYRVSAGKPFLRTGVDYFGPVEITTARIRGAATTKAYVCLFVCMSIKAIHLELVSSLSTEHFLQAFRRFLARRGPCKELISDRGTNFVGAHRVLKQLYEVMSSKEFGETVQQQLAEQGTEWRFNPAAAPHMGGLWEANVKSVKQQLKRVVGEQKLTYEEYSTLLVQIESLLNSRPLCALSTDPEAPEALTPAHFLTLTPLRVLPLEEVREVNSGRLTRFELVSQLVHSFWKRWRSEYLTTLQTRQKWCKDIPNVEIGTVVVVKDESTPPLQWPLGRVVEIYPGTDGKVRVVKLKCGSKVMLRPVHKVCPLPRQ